MVSVRTLYQELQKLATNKHTHTHKYTQQETTTRAKTTYSIRLLDIKGVENKKKKEKRRSHEPLSSLGLWEAVMTIPNALDNSLTAKGCRDREMEKMREGKKEGEDD